ncbi:GAP family protein [Nocardia sp. NPDC001965]
MMTLLLAMTGLAFLDSLDVLLIGVTTAVIIDSRLARVSPLPGGLAFLGGVFFLTASFGLATVLGLNRLTDLLDFRLTPALRFWGELAAGVILLGLACVRTTGTATPPEWTITLRRRPAMLALAGMAIGFAQAPTAVPYLTALAMLSSYRPPPAGWPIIVIAYCALALLPPLLVLALALRRTARAQRIYRRVVHGLARFGPVTVRTLFAVLGLALIGYALVYGRAELFS